MANPKAECRLPQIMHAYLDDLAKVGAFGTSKSGVMRRLIEQGIQDAIGRQIINKRTTDEFPGDKEED